jgi:hypothetical protein
VRVVNDRDLEIEIEVLRALLSRQKLMLDRALDFMDQDDLRLYLEYLDSLD